MKSYKHLTLQDRINIQCGLTQFVNFKKIAEQIGKDASTIAKEVKKHLVVKKTSCVNRRYNPCAKADSCDITRLCNKRCSHYCKTCGNCFDFCKEFVYMHCPKLKSPPYCCNPCKRKKICSLTKQYYYAQQAHNSYTTAIRENRAGYCITQEEAERIGKFLEPLVLQGQSIHHICTTHKDEIMFSEKTIYTYIDAGVFNLKNIDLPRKVRYKLRKKPKEYKVDKKCREGRTYEDFLSFMSENDTPALVQMDTVKGTRTGKTLLTLLFVSCGFMLAFLREDNSAKSVNDIFLSMRTRLGNELFKTLFPVILTDNGSEFYDPESIEFDADTGERMTYIFYCDVRHSEQKGSIEVNHEFIRKISPKGVSLDKLNQADIDLMMSHINSYKRKKFNDLTPYELFERFYGKGVAERFNIVLVDPDDIILKPKLLKKN